MQKPLFPTIMFIAALFKDLILDPAIFFITIAVAPLGWILGVIVGFIYSGVFMLWYFVAHVGKKDTRAARYFLRLFIIALISLIPLVRFIIPETTLFVWFTYRVKKKKWEKKQQKQKTSGTEKRFSYA